VSAIERLRAEACRPVSRHAGVDLSVDDAREIIAAFDVAITANEHIIAAFGQHTFDALIASAKQVRELQEVIDGNFAKEVK
jgi:hypothetical protein